jgi:hypothetical protein
MESKVYMWVDSGVRRVWLLGYNPSPLEKISDKLTLILGGEGLKKKTSGISLLYQPANHSNEARTKYGLALKM